jgi:type I restriction enzyme R subunit
MRRELSNLNNDLVAQNADYVCRVTADEGDIGRGHLGLRDDDYGGRLTTTTLAGWGSLRLR